MPWARISLEAPVTTATLPVRSSIFMVSDRYVFQDTRDNRQAFLDEAISPFNARMATPLVPSVRGIYADGDTVIAFFDAATTNDGQPYRNTHAWYFRMIEAKVVSAVAFFDTGIAPPGTDRREAANPGSRSRPAFSGIRVRRPP
jgi:hypothetical protein